MMTSTTNGTINGTIDKTIKDQIIDSRFECPICLTCLKNPYLTTCGHRFCQKCIQEWLKKEDGCPIDHHKLVPDKDIFPDNYTRREIEQEKVNCPFPDCFESLSLLDLEHHYIEAHEQIDSNDGELSCPFKNIGCDTMISSRSHLIAHKQASVHYHMQLLSKAHNFLISKLISISKGNEKASEADMWSAPAKGSAKSTEISAEHGLIKSLYERIVILEQKTRGQDIELSNAKEKIASLQQELLYFKSHLPLRFCNGTHIWAVRDMTLKLRSMASDHTIMYYSDGFYTSYSGYKFCARLNISPNNGSYLSLLIHLMKGENDHALLWPFSGRITFTIVHPLESEQSMHEVMCSPPGLEAFKRPTKTISTRGFGYTEMISISDLTSRGFINEDDIVYIKIHVMCV